jgi:hypothetical protein
MVTSYACFGKVAESGMLILQILAGIGIVVLGFVFAQLQQISSALTVVSHQLEYLGAPVELRNGKLTAVRKPIEKYPDDEKPLMD